MQEFFTRELKDGVRDISRDPLALVSPCDGTVTSMATNTTISAMIEQVKGISYPGMWFCAVFGGVPCCVWVCVRRRWFVLFPVGAFRCPSQLGAAGCAFCVRC